MGGIYESNSGHISKLNLNIYTAKSDTIAQKAL